MRRLTFISTAAAIAAAASAPRRVLASEATAHARVARAGRTWLEGRPGACAAMRGATPAGFSPHDLYGEYAELGD